MEPPSVPPDPECIPPDPSAIAETVRRSAAATGSFSLGRASASVADLIGDAWTPNGAWYKNGYVKVSADGLRQYRRPAFKRGAGVTRANFESRPAPGGRWVTNAHLDIDPVCPSPEPSEGDLIR